VHGAGTLDATLAIVVLLIAGYSLVAARLDRWSLSPALAFVGIGILLSDSGIGVIHVAPTAEPLRLFAELTLTLLLFSDASGVRARSLQRDALPVGRLLTVGLLLTIAAGTVAAALLFPGVGLGVALLIGAALAPTDAALGQPVVTDRAVPARIRRLLNVESGLNDGIATPFVLLAVSLIGAEAHGSGDWILGAVQATLIGGVTGVVMGFAGGRLLVLADARGWTSKVSRQLFVLMLALACYAVAVTLTGNGFIAAFVAGLAFGAGSRQQKERAVEFTELQGSLLAIGVWTGFGLAIAGQLAGPLWDPRAVVYAVLSLTVLRMVPVALAMLGLRFGRDTVLFLGWFGPRGLASIVFLAIGLEALAEAGLPAEPLAATVTWTVLLSVVLHGLSARPLAARYGRRMATLPAGAPELDDATEPLPVRTSWAADQLAGRALRPGATARPMPFDDAADGTG
jgi:NhaP-type Na+/H+ or K+/H+ antiporter